MDGGSFFLYGLTTNSSELSSDLVGDMQVISNIDNGTVFRLYEAWYQHIFANMRAKIGLIDLNSEFDAIETAGLFLNSSHGIGPDFSQTGENGPSIFPSTSPALLIEFIGFEQWTIAAGIFDAIPNDPARPKNHSLSLGEGALLVAEVNYQARNGLRLGLGFYEYTSQFTPLLDPETTKGGNRGAYGIIEAPVTDRIRGWLRFGKANSHLNAFSDYLGGGIAITEPIEGRKDDQLGMAFSWAKTGDDFKQMLMKSGERPANGELNIELTYLFQINDTLSIQPDIQYVINPGSIITANNALIFGLRFQFSKQF